MKTFEIIFKYDTKAGNGSYINRLKDKSAEKAFLAALKDLNADRNGDYTLTKIKIEEL